MELGAVVVVPNGLENASGAHPGVGLLTQDDSAPAHPICSPRTPILGNDTLELWINRIRTVGVRNLWLASSYDQRLLCSRFTDLSQQGVEKVLVVKLKSYAEMDLTDLLRFHCEKRNPVTEAQDAAGSLGVRLLNCNALGQLTGNGSSACPSHDGFTAHYQFRGYTKRLHSSKERRDLIRDALTGGCAIRPRGQQTQDQVWVAEDATLDPSVRILGPAYIGPRSVIHGGVTIGPYSSVEQDCIIDSGTCVEQSCVLPRTYLAPGLHVRQSVVNGNLLEHLGWQEVVDLAPSWMARHITETALSKWRACFRRPASTSTNPNPFLFSAASSQSWVRVDL